MKKVKLLLLCLLLLSGCTQETKEKHVCKFDAPRMTKVSFVGVGDNLIHGSINTSSQLEDGSYDFSPIYEDIKDDVQKFDIAFINQETPIGGKSLGISGYPMFNSPTELIENIHDAGFNLVNLATNHALDRTVKAIENELKSFKEFNMVVDGVYTSQEAFDTIPTFEMKGITFSLLSYTYSTNGITAPYSYNVSYLNESQIRKEVAKAKEISDVIIVSAHWGNENEMNVSSYQKKYAQLFADLGVDVVIGTHPHVLQPIEWVKGVNGNETLVAYSLGNFLGGMLGVNNAISGMIQFDFVKRNDEITIENIAWEPLFIHFERYGSDIVDDRNNYRIYHVSDYTDELAKKHALNGYNGQKVTLDYIHSITNKVIDSEYLE